MVVCQYFLRGTCRFGDSCRNEHPPNPRSGFGNQSWTNNNNANVQSPTKPGPGLFTQDSLKLDLTSDKPIWPLSTFGPAKFEPNLISNLDESMEELRVKAVIALKAGTVNEYTTYEAKRIEAANEAYNNARNNLAQVYQTALSQSNRPSPSITSSPFTSTASFPSSPVKPNPFTAPTFGQSTFGVKPSTISSTSVFGQPSTLGGNKPAGGATASGGFGAFAGGGTSSLASAAAAMNKPSGQTVGGGAFAAFAGQQPSTFVAGAANTAGSSGGSVFGTGGPLGGGAPSTVFGQTQNPLQLPQQTTSAFGTVQNQPTSVFGQSQPSALQPQQGGGFGAFANQQQQPQSVFGGGGSGAQQQPAQSAFGAPSSQQPQSAFGAPSSQQPQSAFGAPSPQQPQSAFGAPSSQQPAQSVFGAPARQPQSAFGASQSIFGSTSTQPPSVFGGGNGGGSGNPLNPPSVFSNASNPFNTSISHPQSAFSQITTTPNNPFTNPPTAAAAPLPTTTTTSTAQKPPPTTQNLLTNPTTKPDFLAILPRARPIPGKSPYDKTLPPNYMEILPKHVVEAFKKQSFEFGMIPDWVPPVELR